MENLSLGSDFLSNIELYFSLYTTDTNVSIVGEEAHHIMKVMRHSVGDEIYVTNGNGKIFRVVISSTEKNEVKGKIIETFSYENKLSNFTICIPRLRNSDRFEFALEKCVELGFTNFVVFESNRTIVSGDKTSRWMKIATAAMKQSLHSYLPQIKYFRKFEDINSLDGSKIIFEQEANKMFSSAISSFSNDNKYVLLFGPEGGLTEAEINIIQPSQKYSITSNRLRTETAVISVASMISANY